ncbi:hypothetical protein PENTCL1PPCAC_3510, partial [Pristionchus entomophagus]
QCLHRSEGRGGTEETGAMEQLSNVITNHIVRVILRQKHESISMADLKRALSPFVSGTESDEWRRRMVTATREILVECGCGRWRLDRSRYSFHMDSQGRTSVVALPWGILPNAPGERPEAARGEGGSERKVKEEVDEDCEKKKIKEEPEEVESLSSLQQQQQMEGGCGCGWRRPAAAAAATVSLAAAAASNKKAGAGGSGTVLVVRESGLFLGQRRRGRTSMDEKLAEEHELPVSAAAIADMELEEMRRLLNGLTETQRELVKKIRRRGKNKMAARLCRQRRGETSE